MGGCEVIPRGDLSGLLSTYFTHSGKRKNPQSTASARHALFPFQNRWQSKWGFESPIIMIGNQITPSTARACAKIRRLILDIASSQIFSCQPSNSRLSKLRFMFQLSSPSFKSSRFVAIASVVAGLCGGIWWWNSRSDSSTNGPDVETIPVMVESSKNPNLSGGGMLVFRLILNQNLLHSLMARL
jgi:hypothetical protein